MKLLILFKHYICDRRKKEGEEEEGKAEVEGEAEEEILMHGLCVFYTY